jgi:cellulose 1,4-beta-cellobiosidase
VNTGLTNGTVYYYAVYVRDQVGNWNDATTPGLNADTGLPQGAGAPPVPPTGLAGSDVPGDNGAAVTLTWTPSTSASVTQQRVYRSLTSGLSYGLVWTFGDRTTSTFTDTGLVAGTPYYYVVRAFDGALESGNSNEASVTPVDNTAPAAPTALAAQDRLADTGAPFS